MCAGDPLEKARLLLEEAKQARLSEDRTTAIACLSEADKCLDGVTGDQKIVDLAAVLAWRVQVLMEAKSEEVADVLERTKQLWTDVRDQLPNSAAAVNSLRASMSTVSPHTLLHVYRIHPDYVLQRPSWNFWWHTSTWHCSSPSLDWGSPLR